jgi:DNA-binding LytR/AlgR family response regulator
MSPRALIADDEPKLAQHLADELLRLWPELHLVQVCRNGLEAAAAIDALKPELAFLDIQMPGLTGLEVAQGIEGSTRVVFVTAFDDYAVQAFDAEALDYVLKPVTTDRLKRTVERVRRALDSDSLESPALAGALRRLLGAQPRSQAPLKYVRASAGDLMHQIDVNDVLFFQADEKYTCVHTISAEHLIRTTIQELAQQLDPDTFWQVHRSTLINLRFLAGTRRDESSRLWLRLKGHGRELPVSRAYVHLFKAM